MGRLHDWSGHDGTTKGRPVVNIALLPGDGVGPEVTKQAVRVLDAVAQRFGHDFTYTEAPIGGAAIDAVGNPLPDETIDICRRSDAVLLGAVGGPKWDDPTARVRPEQGLLGIRKALGLFLNLRPVKPHAALVSRTPFKPDHLDGVDLVIVRELTGGIYFGDKTTESHTSGERSTDVCTYTTEEVERVARAAARIAAQRSGRVTSVDKANVMETSRLWRRTVTRVLRDEFPDIRLEHMLVDTAAMQLIMSPRNFDVIVTENMFGDILTDEAAVLAGSIGVLPSASLGAEGTPGLYEPIHGSAPTIAGRGIANPIGTILSVALLLRHSLGLEREAAAVEKAVSAAIANGIVTADAGGTCGTEEVGAAIVRGMGSGPS